MTTFEKRGLAAEIRAKGRRLEGCPSSNDYGQNGVWLSGEIGSSDVLI